MTWQPADPYNELPELPPRTEFETKQVLKAPIEARAALATQDQAARRMTNPTVLINSIPLLEAQASSAIGNIATTADDLFRFTQDESAATSPSAPAQFLGNGFRLRFNKLGVQILYCVGSGSFFGSRLGEHAPPARRTRNDPADREKGRLFHQNRAGTCRVRNPKPSKSGRNAAKEEW